MKSDKIIFFLSIRIQDKSQLTKKNGKMLHSKPTRQQQFKFNENRKIERSRMHNDRKAQKLLRTKIS